MKREDSFLVATLSMRVIVQADHLGVIRTSIDKKYFLSIAAVSGAVENVIQRKNLTVQE